MPNYVSLHLGGAGFNCISSSPQVSVGPNSLVNGVGVAAQQLTIRTEQLLRDLLEPLVEFAPEYLLDRPLGPRHACGAYAAECPHLIETHDFNFCAALRELLADDRIFARRPPVALNISS